MEKESLQSRSLGKLFQLLPRDKQLQHAADVLEVMTLEEILEHPVVLEKMKLTFLPLCEGTFMRYMLEHSSDAALIRHCYRKQREEPMIGLRNVSFCNYYRLTRFYHREDRLVLISEHARAAGELDLDGLHVQVLNFQEHVIDAAVSPDNIFYLHSLRVANPDFLQDPWNLPHTIAQGQKEFLWWELMLEG